MKTITSAYNIKLDIGPDFIQETISVYNACCNYLSQYCFDNKVHNKIELHNLTYHDVKSRFDLTSQLLCSAIRVVSGKYSAARKNKTKVEKPIWFTANQIVLQTGPGKDYYFQKNGLLNIRTMKGRQKDIPFQHYQGFDEAFSKNKYGAATLRIVRNEVYLIVFIKESHKICSIPVNMAGCDLGMTNLACVEANGKALFCHGSKRAETKRKKKRIKTSLRRKKAERKGAGKSTRSVRRTLKRLFCKESRFVNNDNHCVSKRVVGFCKSQGCDSLALEDLKGIRKSLLKKDGNNPILRAMIYGWSYGALTEFITYKCTKANIDLIKVNPAYTSQTCSKCHNVNGNHRNKSCFVCGDCGFKINADLNASRNIRYRAWVQAQAHLNPGGTSQLSLSTGEPEASVISQLMSHLLIHNHNEDITND